MNEKIISLIIALSIFLVVREGFQLRDRLDWNKALSTAWHWFGFLAALWWLVSCIRLRKTGF